MNNQLNSLKSNLVCGLIICVDFSLSRADRAAGIGEGEEEIQDATREQQHGSDARCSRLDTQSLNDAGRAITCDASVGIQRDKVIILKKRTGNNSLISIFYPYSSKVCLGGRHFLHFDSKSTKSSRERGEHRNLCS